MHENLQHEAMLPDETEARFTMRFLFVAMAVVAVIAAVAGAIARQLEPATQIRLLATWGIWLALSVLWISLLAHQRRRVEKVAGRALIRLPMFDSNFANMSGARRGANVVTSGTFALFMLFAVSFFSLSISSPRDFLVLGMVMGLQSVWWTTQFVTSLWWRTNVRLGEFGVLWDRRVMLWDHVVQWNWSESVADAVEITGIDKKNLDMFLRVGVPEAQREEVVALLAMKVAQRPHAGIKPPVSSLVALPLSVAMRDRRFWQLIGFVLFGVVGMIVFSRLFHGGFTGVREFDQSVFVGFFVGAMFEILWSWRRTSDVGALLVRVESNRRWLRSIGAVAAAGMAYWAGVSLAMTSAWLGYASGIGFGTFLGMVFGSLARRSIDLRSNGVYMMGASWAWNEVSLLRWNAQDGDLTLKLGRRRVAANVPPEQRDVVDRVLSEKLGLPTDSPRATTNVET